METVDLRSEQERTLATPRMKYGLLAHMLFLGLPRGRERRAIRNTALERRAA